MYALRLAHLRCLLSYDADAVEANRVVEARLAVARRLAKLRMEEAALAAAKAADNAAARAMLEMAATESTTAPCG